MRTKLERRLKKTGWLRPFILYGNVMEGAIAVGFLLGTYALLQLPPSPPLLVLAFCGTFLTYQFERALRPAPEDRYNQPARLAWIRSHQPYVWISSTLALILALGALPFLQPATLLVGLALALISLSYILPLLPRRRRLKSVWFLKPVLIGGAWALGGVLLPITEAQAPLTGAAAALIAYRFLFVLPNALLADWPDRTGDTRAGLRTVATQLPATRLQHLAAASLVTALVGALTAGALFDITPLIFIDLLGPALMLALLYVLPPNRHRGLFLDLVVAWPAVTALYGLP